MYKTLFLFFTLVCSVCQLNAQVFPQEGKSLCYRLIGFSFPAQPNTVKYKIDISKGTYASDGMFEKNITKSLTITDNKVITEVPSFGAEYTWRSISYTAGNVATKSTLHHFTVKKVPEVDTSVTRLRIIEGAKTYQDAYMFIDGNMVLYDMKGNPVWFLPGLERAPKNAVAARDIRVTPEGTITFFTANRPFEINYDGKVLWQYPRGETVVMHHEFTRLGNGHYMGMIYEDLSGHSRQIIPDSIPHYVYDSAGFFRSTRYSNIVEVDENCHTVWQWSGLKYQNTSDLGMRRTADCSLSDFDLHENSFFFDEKEKVIYLGIRNLNRIVKIKYPEGNVLNTYGPKYKQGIPLKENSVFCGQHSCKRSPNGYLYLFNNNSCNTSLPTVVKLKEPGPGGSDLKKIWEYQCTVEKDGIAVIGNSRFVSGGSVTELPDKTMLVMMGLPYPKVFIVNNDKKVLWSAIPERFDPFAKKWAYTDQYRAYLLQRKDLEQLIWNSEK
jgi:hypothetical protein